MLHCWVFPGWNAAYTFWMLSGSTLIALRRLLEPTLTYVGMLFRFLQSSSDLLFWKSNVLYKKLTIIKFVVIIIFKLRFSGKVLITSFCILNFWHHHNFSWLYWIMFYWLFPLNSHQNHFELHNSIIGNQLEIILLEIPYCCQLEIILPEIPYCCPKIKFRRKQLMNPYFIN